MDVAVSTIRRGLSVSTIRAPAVVMRIRQAFHYFWQNGLVDVSCWEVGLAEVDLATIGIVI